MTIQTPHPLRAPVGAPAFLSATPLYWLIEALVLGPDRPASALSHEEDPRDYRRRLRAAEARRENLRDAVHDLMR